MPGGCVLAGKGGGAIGVKGPPSPAVLPHGQIYDRERCMGVEVPGVSYGKGFKRKGSLVVDQVLELICLANVSSSRLII